MQTNYGLCAVYLLDDLAKRWNETIGIFKKNANLIDAKWGILKIIYALCTFYIVTIEWHVLNVSATPTSDFQAELITTNDHSTLAELVRLNKCFVSIK